MSLVPMKLRISLRTIAFAAALFGLARPSAAQACRTPDKYSSHLRAQLVTFMGSNDPWPQVRTGFSVPQVPVGEITIVSDSSLCATAADTYNRQMHRLYGTPLVSRTVDVVRVGSGGYAITDATEIAGEWLPVIFVGTTFVYVSIWSG